MKDTYSIKYTEGQLERKNEILKELQEFYKREFPFEDIFCEWKIDLHLIHDGLPAYTGGYRPSKEVSSEPVDYYDDDDLPW